MNFMKTLKNVIEEKITAFDDDEKWQNENPHTSTTTHDQDQQLKQLCQRQEEEVYTHTYT